MRAASSTGVVSKARFSRYAPGPGNDWVKSTCAQRESLAIAGFAVDGNDWDASISAAAKATTSSMPARSTTASTAAALRNRLRPLIRKTQPYAKKIAHEAFWVEPELLAEIDYGRSPPRARCGTRSSRAFWRTSDCE